MELQKAERLVRDRFWVFHTKLVEEYPEYRPLFDYVVYNAQEAGVLWEVLEFAQYHLDSFGGGDAEDLSVHSFVEALEYGFSEWVK
jgi:hypothetical protein